MSNFKNLTSMKRFLFMSALASVALASCVNDEAMELNPQASGDQKISFNAPIVSGTTRVVYGEQPTTDTKKYSTAERFRVYAQWDKDGHFESWITANNDNQAIYMDDIEVAYDNTVDGWSSDAAGGNVYYWPKTGVLTFAAYSPSDVSSFTHSYTQAGLSVTDFTVAAATANQYDFMYSTRSVYRTKSDNWLAAGAGHTAQSFKGVDILFKHALSSIKFKVKAKETYANTTIRVKQVTILNAYSQGDFAEDYTAGTASWTDHALPVNYTVKTNANNQILTTDAAALAEANDVILLPQAMKHSDAETVKVKVDYSIQNGTGPELTQEATLDLATDNNGGYYKDSATSADIEAWEMGKRYTYTITIGLEKIYFSPEVTEWVDVTVTPDLKI